MDMVERAQKMRAIEEMVLGGSLVKARHLGNAYRNASRMQSWQREKYMDTIYLLRTYFLEDERGGVFSLLEKVPPLCRSSICLGLWHGVLQDMGTVRRVASLGEGEHRECDVADEFGAPPVSSGVSLS